VQKQIKAAFGCEISKLFKSFDSTPVAAASVAQVHKAVTHKNKKVAVKILRPNIEKRFNRDFATMSLGVKILELILRKSAQRLRLHEALKTFKKIVQFELNLKYEAAACDELRNNLQDDSGIRIPRVFWELTSPKVFCMDWIEGTKIDDRGELIRKGFDLHDIAQKLAVTFFNQAYRDGFFHADLHPGNILVDDHGNIALVDFGIMGVLANEDRLFIAEVIHAFIKRDYNRVSELHFKKNIVLKNQDPKLFALACRSIGEPIAGLPANKISLSHLLEQLFAMSSNFEMVIQPQLMLLQKTMVTLEGVGTIIYPKVNLWKLAEPWIETWANNNFGFKQSVKNKLDDLQDTICSIQQIIDKHNTILDQKIESFSDIGTVKTDKKRSTYLLAFLIGVISTYILLSI
jgi:ubiquinone biosynthesis protein